MSDRILMFSTAVFAVLMVAAVCYSLLIRKRR